MQLLTFSLLYGQAAVDADKLAATPKHATDCEVLVMVGLPGVRWDSSLLLMQPSGCHVLNQE